MKTPVFRGSCTAMITPFTSDGSSVDYKRLSEQIDFQEKNGTSALLVAGTTGEASTLEIHEFTRLVDFCVKYVSGRIKIIVGVGGNNTQSCLEKSAEAEALGADAVLMCTPYYNKTTQPGLVEHFTYVADRIKIPLILYNVPGRTSIGIGPDAYKALSEHPNINGVKEASGDFSLVARILSDLRDDLNVWSGNDDNTIPMISLGAQGVISVASNLIPDIISYICALCLKENYTAARHLYYRYAGLISGLFTETNPIPIKAAMEELGRDSGALRLPLIHISEKSLKSLANELKRTGLSK